MQIVTLTTDFGNKDYYAGMLKGALLCKKSDLNLVDITHEIKDFDIVQAAFTIKNIYHSFPKGTIHIVSVNNFYNSDSRFIAAKHEEHYFLGPDNGIFSLIFDLKPEEVYELEYEAETNFPLKDVFANAVEHLTSGLLFYEIGLPANAVQERITLQPVTTQSRIVGSIIQIDNFENAIINIKRSLFERIREGRAFKISFKRFDPIRVLSENYFDVNVGETLCLFNSAGYLEIAVNMGKAATLLGLNVDDAVQVDFIAPD